MKKNLCFVIFIALSAVLIISSCSNEKKSDEKKEMIESLNYKKACELKDFSTAYEIVDKLKDKTREELSKVISDSMNKDDSKFFEAGWKSDEAEKYVVLQEAITVLEESGTNGLGRIVGIAKEHKAESWLYKDLLDVANKIGDTDLAEAIKKIMSS